MKYGALTFDNAPKRQDLLALANHGPFHVLGCMDWCLPMFLVFLERKASLINQTLKMDPTRITIYLVETMVLRHSGM